LGYLVLGYSDLTSLIDLLAPRVEGIEIEAGERKLDNIADLYSASRSDRAGLQIKTVSPRMTIYLCSGGARIEVAGASPTGIDLAEEVRAHLEGRRQKAPVGTVAIVVYGLLAVFITALAGFVDSTLTSPRTAILVTGGLALFALFALLSVGWGVHSSGAVKLRLGQRPNEVEKVRLREAGELPENVTAFRLGFVRLYLDDLDDVVRTLSTRGKSIYLMAGGAELDSVNDLRNATSDELAGVVIGLRKPSVLVEVRRRQAFVYAMEQTNKAVSLADDVARLIGRRGTQLPVGHPHILMSVAFSIGLLVSAPVVIWPDVSIVDRIAVVAYTISLPILSALVYYDARLKGGAKIYRTDRAGRVDIQRSWRQMWIGAAIGAVVSLALTWWQLRG
jgi:hypothetical protein